MKKEQDNFLDYIPKHNKLYPFKIDDVGIVEIEVQNKGLFNRIAQIFFRKPKVSYIKLEEMGSYIWQQIDGNRTVYDIGILLKEQFGEKCEPLYERLSVYIKTLHNNEYIVYQNKIK